MFEAIKEKLFQKKEKKVELVEKPTCGAISGIRNFIRKKWKTILPPFVVLAAAAGCVEKNIGGSAEREAINQANSIAPITDVQKTVSQPNLSSSVKVPLVTVQAEKVESNPIIDSEKSDVDLVPADLRIEEEPMIDIEENLPAPEGEPVERKEHYDEIVMLAECKKNPPSNQISASSEAVETSLTSNYSQVTETEESIIPKFVPVTAKYKGKGPAEFIKNEFGVSYREDSDAYQRLVSSNGGLVKNPNKDFKLGGAYFLSQTIGAAQTLSASLANQEPQVMTAKVDMVETPSFVQDDEPKTRLEKQVAGVVQNETLANKVFKYAMARRLIQSEPESVQEQFEVAKKVLAEFSIFNKRWSEINDSSDLLSTPKFSPEAVDSILSSVNEEATAENYAKAIVITESSARPVLDGINQVRNLLEQYRDTQNPEVKSKLEKALDKIVLRAVGTNGDSGNYQYIYSAAETDGRYVGFKVKTTALGCEMWNGNKRYQIVKDPGYLRKTVKLVIQAGVKQGLSNKDILEQLQKNDLRFDNGVMKILTQSRLKRADEALMKRYNSDLSTVDRNNLILLSHNIGVGAVLKLAKVYLNQSIRPFEKYVQLTKYAAYFNKLSGIIALDAQIDVEQSQRVAKMTVGENSENSSEIPILTNQKKKPVAIAQVTPEIEEEQQVTTIAAQAESTEQVKTSKIKRFKVERQALNQVFKDYFGENRDAELIRFLRNNHQSFATDSITERIAGIIPDQERKIEKLKSEFRQLPAREKLQRAKAVNAEISKMQEHIKKTQAIILKMQEVLATDDYAAAIAV